MILMFNVMGFLIIISITSFKAFLNQKNLKCIQLKKSDILLHKHQFLDYFRRKLKIIIQKFKLKKRNDRLSTVGGICFTRFQKRIFKIKQMVYNLFDIYVYLVFFFLLHLKSNFAGWLVQ